MKNVKVSVQQLPNSSGIPLPAYATKQSAGLDLCAAVEGEVILHPGERKLIPTGIAIALPEGYEAQVRPRSGLAIKNGITVLNSPGTIDADYRGEIQVILVNLSKENFSITRGMRIAQMIVAPFCQAELHSVESLPDSERGKGGFGSTGTN